MQFSKNLSWQGSVVIRWNLDPYTPENKETKDWNVKMDGRPPRKGDEPILEIMHFFMIWWLVFEIHSTGSGATLIFPSGGNKNIATRDLILFSYLQIARFKDSEMYCNSCFQCRLSSQVVLFTKLLGAHCPGV